MLVACSCLIKNSDKTAKSVKCSIKYPVIINIMLSVGADEVLVEKDNRHIVGIPI